MIAAVTQTLIEILVENSPLIGYVEIDLNHPQTRYEIQPSAFASPALSVYLYRLAESKYKYPKSCYYQLNKQNYLVEWYDLSFAIIPWERTVLGQWQLLSEVIRTLIPYRSIAENKLAPELRGFGNLPLKIATSLPSNGESHQNSSSFFYPALYITIQTPFSVAKIQS